MTVETRKQCKTCKGFCPCNEQFFDYKKNTKVFKATCRACEFLKAKGKVGRV